jgi:succinyl-diaminopimelate desuccinylase
MSIEKVTGIKPKHSTAGGTSDARFMAPLGIPVIEFGVKNDTIHSINERTTAKEVQDLYEVFKNLIDMWE